MHHSFGAFNVSFFKVLLKGLHCGARFIVKSLLNAPAPTNDLNHLNKRSIFSPTPTWCHMKWPYFLISAYEWPKFSDTHVYAHISTQILIKPLFSHLHKAGFLMTNLLTNPRVYEKWYINSKDTHTHVRMRVWYSIEFGQHHHSLLQFSYFSNSSMFPSQDSLRMYF